jgi:predicted nucleic acid-binding protein
VITALDSSVIWAIVNQERGHDLVLQILINAASEGPLVISPVAFAELAPSSPNAHDLKDYLGRLDIVFDPISPDAAHLAGTTFKNYRLAGGPREHLVPDFLIAAHAQIQANRLATLDHGYLRRWFPDLSLLLPLSP